MIYDYDKAEVVGDMRIGDVAIALSNLNRYNGWTSLPWSVAAHGCLVAEIVACVDIKEHLILKALHHDDHECIVGDMISPLKFALSERSRQEYAQHAWRAQRAIERKLGIDRITSDTQIAEHVVKQADLAALEAERLWLFPNRMTWATEKLVNPTMLEHAQRIIASDFAGIRVGPPAAERFVNHHNALLGRMLKS